MSSIVQGSGQYKVKDTGETQTYSFEYRQFDSFQDLLETVGEVEVLKNSQRMEKLDANNTAREKAKVENGHSARKVLTEQEKAVNKAKRAEEKAMLDVLKAQGVKSISDLKGLL